jgi:hypothetical protein
MSKRVFVSTIEVYEEGVGSEIDGLGRDFMDIKR